MKRSDSCLPPEYRKNLPMMSKEYLQLFMSKFLEQTRRQLVENEKAINEIPSVSPFVSLR